MKGIVVTPEPIAADAGVNVLKKGGNAIDAAIAAAFVQGVVNPLLCGIGGTGLLFVHLGTTGETFLIDCSSTMGSKTPSEKWVKNFWGRSEAYGRYIIKDDDNQIGYRSIMVPGFVLGAWDAFEKYGSGNVSWKEILEPSIHYAKDGFKIYPYISNFWESNSGTPGYPSLSKKMKNNKNAKAIYGEVPRIGETFIQKDYGNTLTKIAENGGYEFYKGDIGKRIKEDLEKNNSLICKEDIQNYNVFETRPIIGHYRNYEIRGAISGCSSSPQLISMLQILEGFNLKKYNHNSPEYIDLLSRVMRAGFEDHLKLKGDPPFSVALNLLQKFTSNERIECWQNKIKNNKLIGPEHPTDLGTDTTHVSVIDEEGTAVSWTHTLGSLAGAGVVTKGLGFLYNNLVGHFNPVPGKWDSILPGKRGGGGSPLFLYRNNELVMAVGAPGGSRIFTSILQVIINVIDFNMTIQEAVNAPRLHSEEKNIVYLEPEFSDKVESELEKKYNVVRSSYMSRVQVAWRDPKNGKFIPGSDPRGGRGEGVIA